MEEHLSKQRLICRTGVFEAVLAELPDYGYPYMVWPVDKTILVYSRYARELRDFLFNRRINIKNVIFETV